MSRIVVLGGTGYFGRLAVDLLRAAGVDPVVASRSRAEVKVDVEDGASIRRALRADDVALDVVGPFQARSTALVEAAMDVGFHVVDVADASAYAQKLVAMQDRIDASGVAVLTSCSSLSAVSAALVRRAGLASPVRVAAFLRPATRHTANSATALSAFASLGRPVKALRAGALLDEVGLRAVRTFDFPPPVGRARGRILDGADAVHLPRIWPTLRDVDFWLDPNATGFFALLGAGARIPPLRWLLEAAAPVGIALARRLGGTVGVFAVEVEGDGRTVRLALRGAEKTERTAVVPATLAARAIQAGRFVPRGLVGHDRQVDPDELFAALDAAGIRCVTGVDP